MRKRFLVLLLSIVMLLSVMPTTAMAEVLQGDGPSAGEIAVEEPASTEESLPAASPTDAFTVETVSRLTAPTMLGWSEAKATSISYIGEPVELVEGADAHAYLKDNDESKLCWEYYYDLESCRDLSTGYSFWYDADLFTVTYDDGTSYHYSLNQIGYNLNNIVSAIATQSANTRWTANDGIAHAITVSCGDLTCQVPVTILPRPCRVNSLTCVNKPSELVLWEGKNGNYSYDKSTFFYDLRSIIKTKAVYDAGSGPQSVTMVMYETVPNLDCYIVSTQGENVWSLHEPYWSVGETHTIYVVAGDTALPVVVQLAAPIEKLEMASQQVIPLIEGVDGNFTWGTAGEIFLYELPTANFSLKATLTAEAAQVCNNGNRTLIGSPDDICRVLGLDEVTVTSSQATYSEDCSPMYQMEDRWMAGESHVMRIRVGGTVCNVPVKTILQPIISIAPASTDTVELAAGVDGYMDKLYTFCLDLFHKTDLRFTVTFTKSGMTEFGLTEPTLTVTRDELSRRTGLWITDPTTADTGWWNVGEQYDYIVELAGEQCMVPVKIVNAFVASIAPAFTDTVELTEGIDGSYYGTEFSYSLYQRDDLNFTVTFTAAGMKKYNLTEATFTDTIWNIGRLTGVDVTTNMESSADWQVGDSYECTVSLDDKQCTIPVKIAANPVASIILASDAPVELMDGVGGYYAGEEYYLSEAGLRYTVTFTAGAAKKYGLSGNTFTGTDDEICKLTGIGIGYYSSSTEDWQVGGSYECKVELAGRECIVPVTIVKNPFTIVSIVPAFTLPVELTEGVNGWNRYDGFYYTLQQDDFNRDYTVTFTPEIAVLYGLAGTTFTGNADEIKRLTGNALKCGPNDTTDWQVGGSYEFTVSLGDKQCTVPVKIVANPVVSLTPAFTDSVELTDGVDGWEIDGIFYYSLSRKNELRYTATFTADAAKKYGLSGNTFTGTKDEIYKLTGIAISYSGNSRESWLVGGGHWCSASLSGVECTVPVTIVANPVVSIAPAFTDVVELAEGVDGWDRDGAFYYCLSEKKELRYTVTLTGEAAKKYGLSKTTFTGTREEIEKLTEIKIAFQGYPAEAWQVGGSYECAVLMASKQCMVPVTIQPDPYVSKIVCRGKAVELYERTDGYYQNQTFVYFPSFIPDMVQFAVVLTAAGAEKFGTKVLTGTANELSELMGYSFDIIRDTDKNNAVWQVGDQKSFTIRFGGKTCHLPVTIVENPVAAISCSDTVCLVAGVDVYTENDALYYDILRDDPFVTVTLSQEAALQYGAPTFTGRCSEISQMLHRLFSAHQEDSVDWSAGKTYQGTISLLGKNCTVNVNVIAGTQVKLNTTNFPDAALRSYLSKTYDTDGNRFIAAESVREIDCPNAGITNVTGLAHFTQLTMLNLEGNKITAIDLSHNTQLRSLNCRGNKLKTLDVSHNADLEYLNCGDNQISALTLPGESALLRDIDCSGNVLTALDVAKCAALQSLNCGNNHAALKLNIKTLDGLQLTTMGCDSLSLTVADGKQGDGTITGRVETSATAIQLTLSGSSTYSSTAVDGQYQLMGIPDGSYTLEVKADGCVPRKYNCTVSNGTPGTDILTVELVVKGNLNGTTTQNGDAVGVDDMQCLYECLSQGERNGALGDDSAYFEAVADVNEDNIMNILDYQYLYETVKEGLLMH